MKLRIKYCGGCNPIINRSKLVKEVINALSKEVDVEVVDNDADVGLLVGGCQVCCPNLSQIEDQAKQWVIVGGDLVDHLPVSIGQLPQKVINKVLAKYNS
ncbi:MAG TPA: hypothetical protein PLP71_10285 [Syntrophomonadaceae bacterium]|jgi:hypothetical protein|nr:hypothetical protein [Syntrophomonadaceae bacterium]HQD91390.1 hypothetical protein [Syntrophomonadaceae bacterium]